jgi:hypothetical protein
MEGSKVANLGCRGLIQTRCMGRCEVKGRKCHNQNMRRRVILQGQLFFISSCHLKCENSQTAYLTVGMRILTRTEPFGVVSKYHCRAQVMRLNSRLIFCGVDLLEPPSNHFCDFSVQLSGTVKDLGSEEIAVRGRPASSRQ